MGRNCWIIVPPYGLCKTVGTEGVLLGLTAIVFSFPLQAVVGATIVIPLAAMAIIGRVRFTLAARIVRTTSTLIREVRPRTAMNIAVMAFR